jgi:hypothetical protein
MAAMNTLLGSLLILAAASAPTFAERRHWELTEFPIEISPMNCASYPLQIDLDMTNARLTGHLVANGGSGNDVRVTVLQSPDGIDFHARRVLLFDSGRNTRVDLNLALPSGRYQVIVSNQFSVFSSKTVEGLLDVVWDAAIGVPPSTAMPIY